MPGRISSMNRSTMLPLTGGSAEGNGIPSGDGGSGSGLGRFPRSMARTAQTTADSAHAALQAAAPRRFSGRGSWDKAQTTSGLVAV